MLARAVGAPAGNGRKAPKVEPLLEIRAILAVEATQDQEASARLAALLAALDKTLISVMHLERRLTRLEVECAALLVGHHDASRE